MTKKKHTLHQNRVPYLLHINPTTRGGTLTKTKTTEYNQMTKTANTFYKKGVKNP